MDSINSEWTEQSILLHTHTHTQNCCIVMIMDANTIFLVTDIDGSTTLIPKPINGRDLVPVQSTSHAGNTKE